MRVEVLVATMGQKDLSKYGEMNLHTDAVFANQDNRFEYKEETLLGNQVKMITTFERGVSKNRNYALMCSTGDICLLADDDMIYVDDYEIIAQRAFSELPDAGIIIFNLETIGIETRKRRANYRVKRLCIGNVLNYGAARIGFRRDVILKKNLWFSILYGGGSLYSGGEDSLFLVEAVKKGIKIYTYPVKLAQVKQETSTWFDGYNEKYFIDKGVWLANAFPVLKYPLSLYFAFRFKGVSGKPIRWMLKLMISGIKNYERGQTT